MRLRQAEVRAAERRVGRQLERLLRPPHRLVAVSDERRAPRLLGPDSAEVARVAAEVEEPLGRLEVRPGRVGLAVEDEDLARQEVGTREVQRVLRRLEERDRPPEVAQRRLPVALHRRQPSERPVEPDPRVRIEDRARGHGQVGEDLARLAEATEIRERVAQVRREANPRARVAVVLPRELLETPLVELRRLLGAIEVEVGVSERDVDVGMRGRRDER